MEYYTARKSTDTHMLIERSQTQKRVCYIVSCIETVTEGKSNV